MKKTFHFLPVREEKKGEKRLYYWHEEAFFPATWWSGEVSGRGGCTGCGESEDGGLRVFGGKEERKLEKRCATRDDKKATKPGLSKREAKGVDRKVRNPERERRELGYATGKGNSRRTRRVGMKNTRSMAKR